MARQPVQLPSRGGASAAGVGNRAQYLRPAKDTQNSRALASAFSQMNRAFGRIAANEQRIANAQLQDELQAAEEEQQLLEERARFAGLMDAGLGSEEQAALYEANPAAQYSYREGRAEGIVNQFLIDVQSEFTQQDFFGDPAQSDIAREWYQNAVTEAMKGHDTAMIANKMPDIMRTQSSLLTAHANQALITAKDNTESDLSVKYELALISGDLPSLEAAEYEGRNNAYQNFGRDGNRVSTEALIRGLRQAATKDTVAWETARNSYIKLTRDPEYQKLLSTDLNDQLAQGLLDSDRLHGLLATNRAEALERERNVKTEEILQGVETRRSMQDSDYTAEKEALRALGYSAADANKMVEDHLAALNKMYDGLIVQPTAAQRVQIAAVEAELKYEINRDGLIGAAKRDLLADNAHRLDDAAFERVLKFTPDGDSPVISNKYVGNVKSSISGLVDNISATMLNDQAFLRQMGMSDIGGNDLFAVDMRRSEMRSKIEGIFEEELREAAAEWPQDRESQQKFVQDAMYRTIQDLDRATEGSLISMFYKDGFPGVIEDRYLNDATFRRWFEDTGYLEDHKVAKERNAQALTEYSRAAAFRLGINPDFDGSLDAAERVGSQPRVTPETTATQAGSSDDTPEIEPSSITRESLGITRIDRQRQDDGGKVPASIRTFNFGAIGNVSNANAKANFEKAFEDRTLGDQDLPGLDGSDVPTTAFKTVEDGIRYFGWWMAYRGSPETIDDLAEKYYPTGTGLSQEEREKVLRDRADWASGVSSYSGLDQDEEITSDNMSALANGVFSHEAGPGAWTSTKIGTTVDMAALIEEGKQLYEDNK